jgi:hypothetical protein
VVTLLLYPAIGDHRPLRMVYGMPASSVGAMITPITLQHQSGTYSSWRCRLQLDCSRSPVTGGRSSIDHLEVIKLKVRSTARPHSSFRNSFSASAVTRRISRSSRRREAGSEKKKKKKRAKRNWALDQHAFFFLNVSPRVDSPFSRWLSS